MQHRRHPVHAAQAALSLLALCAALAAAAAQPWLEAGWQAAGQARMRFFGVAIYDIRLWTAPGFTAQDFERHVFALELAYLRELRGAAIAQRSLEEMHRLQAIAPARAERWRTQLQALLPDVRAGDRIAGVHLPGRGARFFLNGQPLGEIADGDFAARFFAIWLAPATVEPQLRQALLQGTAR